MHAYYIGCTNTSKSTIATLIIQGQKSMIGSTEFAPGDSKVPTTK